MLFPSFFFLLQEYDYVFNVDIQDGVPALKLPFNITEDPWFAAQKFLEKNELSQLFLDQVAKFIVDNTKGITLGQGPPVISDPLTGESTIMFFFHFGYILNNLFIFFLVAHSGKHLAPGYQSFSLCGFKSPLWPE